MPLTFTQPNTPSSPVSYERYLLLALLALGILGLSICYSGNKSSFESNALSRNQLQFSGKLKQGHMILNLNQRGKETTESRIANF